MSKHSSIVVLAIALFAATIAAERAQAVQARYMWPLTRAQNYNWHGRYAHSAYGQPVALVVPPTANLQTNWGWGVGSSRISRIDHQFGRDYPGQGPFGGGNFSTLPRWPHDTTNFGVYYSRGPW
ncbi:MAG: hypothetical protein ACR2NU_07890 [Aeoliella sp.]